MEVKNKRPLRIRERMLGSEPAKVQGTSQTVECPSVLANGRLMVTLVTVVGGEDQNQELRVIME